MNQFEITQDINNDIVILKLNGFLDAHTVPQFENSIQKHVNDKHFNILVNMELLEYISSAGLGVFMGFIEEIRENGGDIKLSNLSERVYKVFDLLGFPALFNIFEEETEALNSFSAE